MTVPKVAFGSSIDILTMTTYFEIAVYQELEKALQTLKIPGKVLDLCRNEWERTLLMSFNT